MKSTGLTLIGVIVASRLAAAQCPDGTPPPCGPVRQPVPTVVVRQFENLSGDTLDAYLASTLTEDVTAALAASHAVRLVSRATGPGAARYLVTGSVRRTRDAVRIAAQVQQAGSGRIAWTTRLDQPVRALASVPDSLAEGILRAVGVRVPVRAAT
ncbi:MAG: hypothetical protein Q8S13_09685, partial [Dehalococcoidia bacterium]|nr:hypothetical protein [Dehalococcoidia bacterium]